MQPVVWGQQGSVVLLGRPQIIMWVQKQSQRKIVAGANCYFHRVSLVVVTLNLAVSGVPNLVRDGSYIVLEAESVQTRLELPQVYQTQMAIYSTGAVI